MKHFFLTLLVATLCCINVNAVNAVDFIELFPGYNLSPDPDCNSTSPGGWGNHRQAVSPPTGFSGSYCGEAYGGSYDQNIVWEPLTCYRVRALVYATGSSFQMGVYGIGCPDISKKPTMLNVWEIVDFYFTTTQTVSTSGGMFFNGGNGYIDNVEVYKWATDVNTLEYWIDSAEKIYIATNNGASALLEAINVAKAIVQSSIDFDNITTIEAVNQQVAAVKQAIETYKTACNADKTSSITNPSFENSLTNWTNSGFSSQTNTSFELKNGSTYAEKWSGSALSNSSLSQLLTDLPDGVYSLKVAANASISGSPNTTGTYIFAGNNETEVNIPKDYEIFGIVVSGGRLNIGIKTVNTTANWVSLDNFRLYYYGYDLTSIINELSNIINDANEYVGKPMEASVATELTNAINDGNEAILSQVPAQVQAATLRLSAANTAASQSISAYLLLKNAIDVANLNKTGYSAYSGYTNFETVIGLVEQNYTNGFYSASEIQDIINELRSAEIACRITNNTVPADFTFAIWNPSFEEGQGANLLSGGPTLRVPNYWSVERNLIDWIDVRLVEHPLSNDIPHQGSYMYNVWASGITNFNLYQEVSLPSGDYTLTAFMRTEKATDVIDQYIYAKIGEIKNKSQNLSYNSEVDWNSYEAWIPLTVDFKVTQATSVTIGAESNGGWFQLDDFQLTRTKDIPTGIDRVNQDKIFSAIGVKGGVLVNSATFAKLNVYSITSQLVKNLNIAEGETFIPLAPGMYIVNNSKIFVK